MGQRQKMPTKLDSKDVPCIWTEIKGGGKRRNSSSNWCVGWGGGAFNLKSLGGSEANGGSVDA